MHASLTVLVALALAAVCHGGTLQPGFAPAGGFRHPMLSKARRAVSKQPLLMRASPSEASSSSVGAKLAGLAAGLSLLLSPAAPVHADLPTTPAPPSTEAMTFNWKGATLSVSENNPSIFPAKSAPTCVNEHWSATLLATTEDTGGGFADLPPCLPWSSGPCVSIRGECFADESECGLKFKECADNKDCLKSLSCLARCGGDPTCSTGCFAAFGDDSVTGFMSCILEDKECLSFPKDPKLLGWLDDGDAAPKKMPGFKIESLKGDWTKVYGLDSRYDCFECQQNRFRTEGDEGWRMDTTFRLPRPRGLSKLSVEAPLEPNTFKWPSSTKTPDTSYFQNDLTEEVIVDKEGAKPTMHTKGRTFGLTFWENYYIVGQGKDFQFVRYIGHTLQGGYKGSFVLARQDKLGPESLAEVKKIAKEQGLDFSEFCQVKNDACGTVKEGPKGSDVGEFVGDANKYVKFMFDRQVKVPK